MVVGSPGSSFKPFRGAFPFLTPVAHSFLAPAAAGRAGVGSQRSLGARSRDGTRPHPPPHLLPQANALFLPPVASKPGFLLLLCPSPPCSSACPSAAGGTKQQQVQNECFLFFYSIVATSFSPLWLQGEWAAVPELTALPFGTLCRAPTLKGLFALRRLVPSL